MSLYLNIVNLKKVMKNYMEIEIWKPIKGLEGTYEVSSFGRVKRLSRIVTNSLNRVRTYPEKILKMGSMAGRDSYKGEGYLTIRLTIEQGKDKLFLIHRLVALAFLGKPKLGYCVNHIDGIKTNNNINNLEWVTYSQNTKHAYKLGLMKDSYGRKKQCKI